MIINNKNISSLELILTDLQVEEAKPKENYVNVPYGVGSIDLTEALGAVTYHDRKLKANFALESFDEAKHSALVNDWHGQKGTISTVEGFHFVGRIKLSGLTKLGTAGLFELEATCEPYMYKDDLTVVSVDGSQEVNLPNLNMVTVPTIITDAEVQIVHGANSFVINAGTHVLPIVLRKGDNTVQINGTANVRFEYQEGVL